MVPLSLDADVLIQSIPMNMQSRNVKTRCIKTKRINHIAEGRPAIGFQLINNAELFASGGYPNVSVSSCHQLCPFIFLHNFINFCFHSDHFALKYVFHQFHPNICYTFFLCLLCRPFDYKETWGDGIFM